MKLCGLFLATALGVRCYAAQSADPVCIIGAGPAGLTVANRLESQGRKTVIFESQPEVGGKCQAFYDTHFHPLGALLFTNGTYREALKIINKVEVPAVPFLDGMPRWAYDYLSGAVQPVPNVSALSTVVLIEEIARYSLFWATEFSPLYSSVGYKNGVPQEFTVTTAEWLSEHNYEALPVLFNQGMVAYGYGDLRETPILYMLQYFTPDVILAFARIVPGYLIDFHEVFVRYANSSVRGPIHLSSPVIDIDRSSDSPKVTYQTSHPGAPSTQTQACSALVLAFPPTLSALRTAGLQLTADEAAVFGAVATTAYFSGAVALAGVPAHALWSGASASPALPPPAAGEPVAFVRLFDDSPVATTWSWAAAGANVTVGAARDLLVQTLGRLNKDPAAAGAASQGVADADVRAFRGADYFPHFAPAQLTGGWYAKFDALQGRQRTYFASGLNGFETVEFAVRAGIDVAGLVLKA